MDRRTRTLFLALVRRTAPLLIVQVVLTAILCVYLKDADLSLGNRGSMSRNDVRTLVPSGWERYLATLLLIGVNTIFCIGTLIMQHSDSARLRIGLPLHMYLLPMSYRRIATVHAVYGILVTAFVTGITAVLTRQFLYEALPPWRAVATGMILFALLQVFAFAYGGRSKPLKPMFAAAAFAVIITLVVRNEQALVFLTSLTAIPGLLITLALSALLIEWSIRVGRTNRFSSLADGPRIKAESVTRKKPFSSPAWTQAWYEWRTIGWVLPALTGIILVTYFVIVPIITGIVVSSTTSREATSDGLASGFAMHWINNQHIIATGLYSTAAGAGALAGAYMFLVSGEWRRRSTFLRTRPIPVKKLAAIRLSVLFGSTAVSALMLMAVYAVVNIAMTQLDPGFDYLLHQRKGFSHVPEPLIVMFFAGTLFMLTWTGLWIVNAGLGFGLLLTLMLVSGLVTQTLIAATEIPGDHIIFYAAKRAPIWIASIFWIVGTLALYKRARDNQAMPRGVKRIAALSWLLYTVPFLYYGLGIRFYALVDVEGYRWQQYRQVTDLSLVEPRFIPFTHPVDWVLWAGLSIFPILPLISLPHRLHNTRCE